MQTARIKPIFFLLLLLLLSSCSFADRSNTIEEISPVVMLYLDQSNDGSVMMSTLIPPLKKEKKFVLTTVSTLLKEERYLLNLKYNREMKTGQIRMIFFSDKLAKKGLMDLINPLLLDPNISGRVYLAIVNGDMIGYLNHQLNNRQEQIELSLYQMFTHYEKQDQLTTVNLHQFMESFYNPYSDPVLPYYSISNHELHYQGTAFFLKDRMVGVIRPPKDVFFQMLRRREGIQKTVPIQDLGVVLSSVKTERHIHYTDSFREAQIIIELQGHVAEYHDSNPQDYMSFKSSLERQLESELEKIVLHTQTLSIDPFNMGMETKGWIRRPFNGEQWKKHWPEVRVSVKLLVKLDNIGTIYPSLTRGGERLMRREINNESSSLPHFGVAHDSNVIWMQHPN